MSRDEALSDREKWNKLYQGRTPDRSPNPRLVRCLPLLTTGRALDVATGLGQNALYLAQHGWRVTGIDVSDEALRICHRQIQDSKATVNLVQGDLTVFTFKPASFSLILCAYYLERALIPQLMTALKPDGSLFFETYTTDHLKYNSSFKRAYCLESGELKRLFHGYSCIHYSETDDGNGAFETIVVRK